MTKEGLADLAHWAAMESDHYKKLADNAEQAGKASQCADYWKKHLIALRARFAFECDAAEMKRWEAVRCDHED